MEDGGNSFGTHEGTYNELISEEEFSTDEQTLYSRQEKPQVSMSMGRPVSGLNPYKLLTVILAGLAVVLLAVDIGLGAYYKKLTDGQRTVLDIGSEVSKLQATYNTAVQNRDEAINQLLSEISKQKLTKWELAHQNGRSVYYAKRADKIKMDVTVLKSHVPMIVEGCRHCLPGWTFMNSVCYYFPFTDAIERRSWQHAREDCEKQGADLAVIDSREKQLAITELINNYQDPTRQISHSGFWIGLRDVEEEGTWKWLDGTRLAEGYWNEGEPNNWNNDEDCAAVYPRDNPFTAWNDAPCDWGLKWICEMTPRPVG